jgi:phage-related protein
MAYSTFIFKKIGGERLRIHDYISKGGNDVIKEFLSALPDIERAVGYRIRHKIIENGLAAFKELNTRQLKGKLWEIKFSMNRVMYIIVDKDNVHFLHACRKQKDKAEQFELETAIQRAREKGFEL